MIEIVGCLEMTDNKNILNTSNIYLGFSSTSGRHIWNNCPLQPCTSVSQYVSIITKLTFS